MIIQNRVSSLFGHLGNFGKWYISSMSDNETNIWWQKSMQYCVLVQLDDIKEEYSKQTFIRGNGYTLYRWALLACQYWNFRLHQISKSTRQTHHSTAMGHHQNRDCRSSKCSDNPPYIVIYINVPYSPLLYWLCCSSKHSCLMTM